MITQRRQLLNRMLRLTDLLIVVGSFTLAFWVSAAYPNHTQLMDNHLEPITFSKAAGSRLLPRWLLQPGVPAVTSRPSRSGDRG